MKILEESDAGEILKRKYTRELMYSIHHNTGIPPPE
jgi:hypothetical protein